MNQFSDNLFFFFKTCARVVYVNFVLDIFSFSCNRLNFLLIIFLFFKLNEYILIASDFVSEIIEINIHWNFDAFIISFIFRQILKKNFTIVNNFAYAKTSSKIITLLNIIIFWIDKLIFNVNEK